MQDLFFETRWDATCYSALLIQQLGLSDSGATLHQFHCASKTWIQHLGALSSALNGIYLTRDADC